MFEGFEQKKVAAAFGNFGRIVGSKIIGVVVLMSALLACGEVAPPPIPPVPGASPTVSSHGEWRIVHSQSSLAGGTIVGIDPVRFSCIRGDDGEVVSRVNIRFARNLQNDEREVRARTMVAGERLDVGWLTWTKKHSEVRLRGRDAREFARAIRERDARSFWIELQDDPDLSQGFPVAGLEAALRNAGMQCFD